MEKDVGVAAAYSHAGGDRNRVAKTLDMIRHKVALKAELALESGRIAEALRTFTEQEAVE